MHEIRTGTKLPLSLSLSLEVEILDSSPAAGSRTPQTTAR